MGKKKGKKKLDARGYGPSAAQTKPQNKTIEKYQLHENERGKSKQEISVSKNAHQNLIELLDDLKITIRKETGTEFSNMNKRPDWHTARFISKLTNIYDKLIDCGFNDDLIRQAVKEIGGSLEFSVDSCLDWFCLNLPSTSLPSVLTEVLTNEQQKQKDLAVIVADKINEGSALADQEHEKSLFIEKELDQPSLLENDALSKKEKTYHANNIGKQVKDLILQKYQYEESSTSDTSGNDNDTDELTSEENRLHELKNQIGICQSELNDEFASYMRSKHETKDMQKRLKQMQIEVQKLEGKIKKNHAERKQQKNNEDQQDDDEGMVSLFDGEDIDQDGDDAGMVSLFDIEDADNKTIKPSTPSESLSKIPTSPAIPKNWTGATPKKYLEEYCRKHKYDKPKFQELYPLNYRVTVYRNGSNDRSPLIVDNSGPFYDFNDAKEYLATQILYEMNSNLPLYRIFPPTFNSLWKSWLDEKESLKYAKFEKVKGDKKARMIELARLVAPVEVVDSEKKVLGKPSILKGDNEDSLGVNEYWSESENAEISANNRYIDVDRLKKEQSKVLIQEFISTQKSAKYKKMKSYRSKLPMFSFRQELLDTVANNQVTILCAETGAGKSTQCGQYILENALMSANADNTNIICTQPRRISAISLAERVADEMCTKVGDVVGYHIRMESCISRRTKLLFCTTGVILRRLQDDPDLKGVSVVIVDEVHERQWQIDFLLIALRELIRSKRKDLKVVLMSATLDSRLFSAFFNNAPFLSVPGRTYPVASYYLEDLFDATDHVVEEGSRYSISSHRKNSRGASSKTLMVTKRGGDKRREVISLDLDDQFSDAISNDYIGYKLTTRRSMDRVDEQVINYDLIEDILLLMLITPEKNKTLLLPNSNIGDFENNTLLRNGSVLIFLPGMGEIRNLSDRLKGHRVFGDSNCFDIIPMHSTLSPKDQKRAFIKPRKGCQKIIIATNIAETSVTIPDVICVIDSGLVREVRLNKRSMTSTLETDYCSKASAKQRSGRAGRIQSGICCRLFSSKTYKHVMKEQAIPELQRVPLEEVCLGILAGSLSTNCMDFLSQAPQPPSEQSVCAALNVLVEVGAIEESIDFKVQKLTTLGYHLARLPVHVRLGKILIFGVIFQCLDRALTIAATLSSKSPFSANIENGNETVAAHKIFKHSTSDFLTFCNVWEAFQLQSEKDTFAERKFCDRHHLNWAALIEIKDARQQFFDLLCSIGFVRRIKNNSNGDIGVYNKNDNTEYNTYNENEQVVTTVICAGLYPNIAHGVKLEPNAPPELSHKKERVYFHASSVNANATTLQSEWVVFYEKFETHRVNIAATSQVNPFALLLFGGPIAVKYMDRLVTIDEWITLKVAAQTGVIFRELRFRINVLLKEIIEQKHSDAESRRHWSELLKKVAMVLTQE